MAAPPIVLDLGAPFDGSRVPDEDHFYRFSRNAGHGDGVDVTIFGDSSGSLLANSPTRQVTVQPFYLHVGGVQAEQSTAVVIDMPAASAGSRLDRIVTRREPANNRCVLDVLVGTSGSGTAPAVTQIDGGVWEYSHGVVPVHADGSLGSARDERVRLNNGGRYGLSTFRPPDRRTGDDFYELDTGQIRRWDGSTWVVLYEDTGEVNVPLHSQAFNWDNNDSVVERVSGTVSLRGGLIRRNSTFPQDSTAHLLQLPAGFAPKSNRYPLGFASNSTIARITVRANGSVEIDGQTTGSIQPGNTLFFSHSWVVG